MTGIVLGVLAGFLLRIIVVLVRKHRASIADVVAPTADFAVYGIEQADLDRLLMQPGCPIHDAHHLADWLANLTGETIVMQGESLVVAVPDE